MGTITTSRKELFLIIDEVIKELRKKLYSDPNNISYSGGNNEFWVGWHQPHEDDRKEEAMIKSSSADMHIYISNIGMKVGFSFVRVEKGRDKYKDYKVIFASTRYKANENVMRTSLRWYEHFHPTVIRLKKFLKESRAVRLRGQAVKLEHDLAKMIPDRIDNILLGGNDESHRDG